MSLNIKSIDYKNFGKCLLVLNDKIKLIITTDLGPRIVHFSLVNEDNIFYVDEERTYKRDDDQLKACFGDNSCFYYYGGHRFSLSPRSIQSFLPDNDNVVYSVKDDKSIELFCVSKILGVSFSMTLLFDSGFGDVMIIHKVKNESDDSLVTGVLASTMLKSGGVLILPQNVNGVFDEFSPNRSFSFWPGSYINDDRLYLGSNYVTVTGSNDIKSDLRFGINDCMDQCVYKVDKQLFLINYVYDDKIIYPDFNSSLEAYVDKNIFEIGTMSPSCVLNPGESVEHIENWSIYETDKDIDVRDEEQIEDLLKI